MTICKSSVATVGITYVYSLLHRTYHTHSHGEIKHAHVHIHSKSHQHEHEH
jgi:hypothetical protein